MITALVIINLLHYVDDGIYTGHDWAIEILAQSASAVGSAVDANSANSLPQTIANPLRSKKPCDASTGI